MVHLYYTGGGYFCGGSLIGPLHVLTAAHCTNGETAAGIKVSDATVYAYSSSRNVVGVAAIYQYSGYDSVETNYDASVLKLKAPLPESSKMRTIKLATTRPSVGLQLFVAGWGKTESGQPSDYLLYTSVPVISQTSCRTYGGSYADTSSSEICAFVNGRDACQGDSGGPIFSGQNDYALQYGLTSWGVGCGTKPGVYASVPYFRNWIASYTGYYVNASATTTNTAWKGLCESAGGTYKFVTGQMQCNYLDMDKIRTVNYAWTPCSTTSPTRALCNYVGRFTCVNGVSKCTRL